MYIKLGLPPCQQFLPGFRAPRLVCLAGHGCINDRRFVQEVYVSWKLPLGFHFFSHHTYQWLGTIVDIIE